MRLRCPPGSAFSAPGGHRARYLLGSAFSARRRYLAPGDAALAHLPGDHPLKADDRGQRQKYRVLVSREAQHNAVLARLQIFLKVSLDMRDNILGRVIS